MNYKFEYKDDTERQSIITNNKDKYLIEEQNLTEGNFLIFSDVKPVENQLKNLQDNQLIVMNAIADLYSSLNTGSTSTTG